MFIVTSEGFIFAPAERDVYSCEHTPKRSRSFRSETRQRNDCRWRQAVALLRSVGVKKGPPSYKHLAPMGRRKNKVLLHCQLEFAFFPPAFRRQPIVF